MQKKPLHNGTGLKNIPPPGLCFLDRRATIMPQFGMRRDLHGANSQKEPTEKEKRLLQMIRSLKFGEIHIYVADGQPVRAEEIRKSVKF